MGCTTSVLDGENAKFIEKLKRELEDPKYNNLTQVCPECHLKGILYVNDENSPENQNLSYCNCGCGLNLCNFHRTKHEIKQPLRYD